MPGLISRYLRVSAGHVSLVLHESYAGWPRWGRAGIGSWRGQRPSVADYVTGTRGRRGTPPPEGANGVVALGEHAAGLFTNDDTLRDELKKAGEETFERLWPVSNSLFFKIYFLCFFDLPFPQIL